MKTFVRYLAALIFSTASYSMACTSPASMCSSKPSAQGFALIQDGRPASIIVESTADSSVQRAARAFAQDLGRVSGKKAALKKALGRGKRPVVVIGTLGQSALIDGLVKAGKLNADDLVEQWEAYRIAVVKQPWPKVDRALIIVGSDRRGAVFGTFDLSAKMGVSPWYWFADAPVQQQANLYITEGDRKDQPKVRYRGIFINDEDPALSGWARKRFGGVNAQMYERVFELILRLKGNYLWPAMWGKAFHVDDPRNTALADEMGIVVGSSHHEPMNRAQAEWHRSPDNPALGGAWNYQKNTENLRSFWRGGIERMMAKGNGESYESLLTVGMRGDGDEPMSEGTAIELLETVVADQRQIIKDVTGKPLEQTPQVWALYKEVQDYYDEGMTVPDDVTLLFADDNWGQIRRLPSKNLDRAGGFGVYYHFDYVGAPRNYKWANTNQVEKVWQQMDLAYERGARTIWVVNVGDIKPMEYPLSFFMDMAWNPEQMRADELAAYAKKWSAQTFGPALAAEIAELVTRYGQYSAKRKPELINEETFALGSGTGKVLNRGEFRDLIDNWRALVDQMTKVKAKTTPAQRSAFFQLVEYPIASLANLYEMYYAAAMNRRLASHHDARANYFMDKVKTTYARDAQLTEEYHSINGGKWDGMMNQVHMNYTIWNTPTEQVMPSIVKVSEGRNNTEILFAPKKNHQDKKIELEASEFSRAVNAAGLSWKAIPNLGQSLAAVLALPQGQPATSVEDGVRLEYDFSMTSTRDVRVVLHLAPTLDTFGKEGLRIGLSLDDGPVEVLNYHLIPTSGAIHRPEQKAWSDAVINNGHMMSKAFKNISQGGHTLKVWRLDDNVVLEKVSLEFL